jgi:hypothetical protein
LHRNQATLSQRSFVKIYFHLIEDREGTRGKEEKQKQKKKRKKSSRGQERSECMTGHHRSGYAVMASRRLALAVLITALTFVTCETAQESAEALNRKIRAAFATKSKDAATTGTTASARGEAIPDPGIHGSTRHVMSSSATPSPPGDVGSPTTSSNSNESSEPKTAGHIIRNGSIRATCCQ